MTCRPSHSLSSVVCDAGRGVAAQALAEACDRSCMRIRDDRDWPVNGPPRILVSAAVEADLDQALSPPYSGIFEWWPGRPVTLSEACLESLRQGGLAMSMSTVQGYGIQLAAVFAAALAWRLRLSDRLGADIEMALQEAVANALVHGNLEVSSEPRGDAAGFAAYCSLIGDRLADPLMAARRVEVCGHAGADGIVVTVTDEGLGFDMTRELAREALWEDKSGRGLRIIKGLARRVEPLENGRRLVMVFGNDPISVPAEG